MEHAALVARSATSAPRLRVGIIDASYGSTPQKVQARYRDLVVHESGASVPEQYQRLLDGRLDVGIGRAALTPVLLQNSSLLG